MIKKLFLKSIIGKDILSILYNLSPFLKEGDIIFIDFQNSKRFLKYDGNNNFTILKTTHHDNNITFAIIEKFPDDKWDSDWQKIFVSPSISIIENKKHLTGSHHLRWGLNQQEMNLAKDIARKSIQRYLAQDTPLNISNIAFPFPEKFNQKCNVGVALWIDGSIRGSVIAHNKSFVDGIIYAATLACRDSRFLPISLNDLSKMRIQITLIFPYKVPLLKKELSSQFIDTTKAYKLSYKEKTGWFLPEVFNSIKFNNLETFIYQLSQEKAHLNSFNYPLVRHKLIIEKYSVQDFIESSDLKESYQLIGPMIEPRSRIKEDLLKNSLLAADWLLTMQDSVGNFKSFLSTSETSNGYFTYHRSVFAGWALAELGKIVKKEEYITAAESTLNIHYHYLMEEKVNIPYQLLNMAYLGQLALALDDKNIARICAEEIHSSKTSDLDTISLQQMASFLAKMSWQDKKYISIAIKYLNQVEEIFKNNFKKNNTQLAEYAELINTYSLLYSLTRNKDYLQSMIKIFNWLRANQMPEGYFKISSSNYYSNTRTTGKIIEVLPVLLTIENTNVSIEDIKTVLFRSIQWFFSMQYNEENTFFISNQLKGQAKGSFRHTALDRNSHIDSASHLILGISRLLIIDLSLDNYS